MSKSDRHLLHAIAPDVFAREHLGFTPEPFQATALRSRPRRALRLWPRQAGKSSTSAIEATHAAVYEAPALVLCVAPTLRQSTELFRKVDGFMQTLGEESETLTEQTKSTLTTARGSRVVAVPGANADVIRGYSAPALVLLDEASRIADAIYHAIRPMLARGGRLVAMTTPAGKRGFFSKEWHEAAALEWERQHVPIEAVSHIDPAFLAEEKRALGPAIYRQEYECSFEDNAQALFDAETLAALCNDDIAPLFGPEGTGQPTRQDLSPMLRLVYGGRA